MGRRQHRITPGPNSGSPSAMAVAVMSRSAIPVWLISGGDHQCRYPPQVAGGLSPKRDRAELALGALPYFHVAGVLVVHVVLAAATDLVRVEHALPRKVTAQTG